MIPAVASEGGERRDLTRPGCTATGEMTVAAAGLSLVAILATVVTARKSLHTDQVIDADIAIHLIETGRPLSCSFAYSVPGEPAPSGWPVYDLALAAWLRVWGVTPASVAAFYPAIVVVVSLSVCWFLARSRLIVSPRVRVATVLAMPLLPAVVSVCVKGRYDAMGMLGLAVALLALVVEGAVARFALLAAGGVTVGAGGFDVTLASGPFAAMLLVCAGWRRFREAAVFLACVAAGLGGAFAKMHLDGTLGDFLECMRLSGVDAAEAVGGRAFRPRVVEPYWLFLALAVSWLGRCRNDAVEAVPAWKIVTVAVGSSIVVPTFIGAFGHYSKDYRWLSAMPLLGCVAVAASSVRRPAVRWALLAAIALPLASGWPARALSLACEWDEQDFGRIDRFVGERIEKEDVVFASYPLYFAVIGRGADRMVGGAFHRMTEVQKRSITVAFLSGRGNGASALDPTTEEALKGFGGEWHETDRILVPRGRLRESIPPAVKNGYCYEVRVFRRGDGDTR